MLPFSGCLFQQNGSANKQHKHEEREGEKLLSILLAVVSGAAVGFVLCFELLILLL